MLNADQEKARRTMTEGMDWSSQVLSFVLDSLQVVSYKWLSRKFSITSNEAKRLLQSVAEQHGSNIDIIYAVSGWAKADHGCYSVKLVPKSKLQEAKDTLDGHISTHVYSIQPCIPKDPAELWSAEYVQSEELFKEPSDQNNCLRDNRFSAVSCSSVTRQVRDMKFSGSARPVISKASGASSSFSKVSAPSSSPPKLSVVQADVLEAQLPTSVPSKESVQGTSVVDIGIVSKGSEGLAGPATKGAGGTKKKVAGSGEGALANLWGRASSKSKPALLEAQLAAAANTVAMETLEQANDRPIDSSSDDEDAANFARIRRGDVKSSSKRTRRMIVDDDMSDEDNADENIVHLSSPELPKEKQGNRILSEKNGKQIDAPVQHLKEAKVDSVDIVLDKKKKPDKKVPIAELTNKSTKLVNIGATPKAEETNKSTKVVNIGAKPSVPEPKKRKVVKTSIDERGREVTEVVWETENPMTSDNKEENGKNGANGQQHAQMGLSSAPNARALASATAKASNAPMQNPTNKAGGNKSSGKGSSKDANQGRISSFFKKAS